MYNIFMVSRRYIYWTSLVVSIHLCALKKYVVKMHWKIFDDIWYMSSCYQTPAGLIVIVSCKQQKNFEYLR